MLTESVMLVETYASSTYRHHSLHYR